MRRSLAPVLVSLLAACSGSTSTILTTAADGGASLDGHAAVDTKSGQDAGATHDGVAPRSDATDAPLPPIDASGPRVTIRIVAVQTPISGESMPSETPVDQRAGIYGLTLRKSASDPSPLVVFRDATPIDTPYNGGSNTVLATVPASELTAGTYTVARVPVGYVKFTVAGTYHDGTLAVAGDFTDLIALTSGVSLDGAARDRAWWSSSFSVAGTVEGSATGENAEIAQPGSSSHIDLDLSQTVAAYVFPINLTIPASITESSEIVFTVNTYEDFHWTDEAMAGYQTDVFDVSSASFEPVTQLGGNSFTVTFGPAP